MTDSVERKGWILVHEVERSKKGEDLRTLVRVSGIDAISERRSYTTLFVGGIYLHVKERFEDLTISIDKAEGEPDD